MAGIWQVHGAVPVAAETVLPNGVVELIFNLGEPHRVLAKDDTRWYRDAWLAGMQQGPLVIASQGSTDLMGVRFRPGGARAVFGLRLDAVTDDVVELDVLDRDDAAIGQLRDQLVAAHPTRRIGLLESALLRRLVTARHPVDRRVTGAVGLLGRATSLRELADRVGITHKHLIDRFHADVGVTPSRLRRILRFDAVVKAIAGDPRPRWVDLAARLGFSDQSHLVREFWTFAGVTPTEFLRLRLPDQAHLDASGLQGVHAASVAGSEAG